MSPTKTTLPSSRSIARALAWARGRFWRQRSRRFLLIGFVAVFAVICWLAIATDWSTWRLTAVGAGLLLATGLASFAAARVWPIPPDVAARVADRGLDLGDRLITGLDPGVGGPFEGVVRGELEARLEGGRGGATPRLGPVPRLPRWIRRWRFHLLVLVLLALLFSMHGVFGPGLRPRAGADGGESTVPATIGGVPASLELELDRGTRSVVARGAPIPARVRLRGGEGDPLALRIRVDDSSPLALPDRVAPDGEVSVDLGPVMRRAERDTPGEHTVYAFVEADDGRTLRSQPLRIVIADGSGGGGSRGGEQEPQDEPKDSDEPKDEPAPDKPADRPPPLAEPERVEIVRRPFFVAPLIDENGEVVEGERWTLDYLTGGDRAVRSADEARSTSLQDLLQQYERQAERAMARDEVPPRLREVYRRYLRELTRR